MILIADGGGSKTHWLPLDKNVQQNLISGAGFSPFTHSPHEMDEALLQTPKLSQLKSEVREIYYFGAGCTDAVRREMVRAALHRFFPMAQKIAVDGDLTAAVIAGCGNKAGICCILGTGSNACLFDGEKMRQKTPALGYVLGDEGGGAYFGKRLLRDYFYGLMPKKIRRGFAERHDLEKNKVLQSLFAHPETAKPYLASFFRFAAEHKSNPYIKKLLFDGLNDFLELHVCVYEQHQQLPIHFVGSVAYVLDEELRQIAGRKRLRIGKIIKEPIFELGRFYLNNRQ